MFKKILIANRGEIAVRVIRACHEMGIAAVVVYSDVDRAALHVRKADEAYPIGAAAASESYLSISKILDIAKRSGADAIHPGYGFLSENAKFAQACADAGVKFIGPTAAAMEAMGSKTRARQAVEKAGVPFVPGTSRGVKSFEEAEQVATRIGYPVMLKAAAGGGGKGMRLVHASEQLKSALEGARSEAERSFGDSEVYIEKAILNPRHIEMQVLADEHGNTVYLGERECSLQRRHQKVLEEAPSPLIDAEMRRRMGEVAVQVAKAARYCNAGTVEFLVDAERSFYFLEMNTRLQVEHPVTELITGLDLVEQMIRVAAGEELKLAQKDVTLTRWAGESRVCGEDPFRSCLPSIGRLVKYRPPAESSADGVTVRNDTGVQEGGEIPIYYDPMIAKLVTHAPSRAAAIEAQSMALDSFYIDGIRHNIPFLSALMNHPRWREGKLSTGFIAEEFPKGFAAHAPAGEVARRLAAVAAAIDHVLGERKRQISGQMIGRPVQRAGRRVVWLER